jgi:outer membrane protein assembly factor BamB
LRQLRESEDAMRATSVTPPERFIPPASRSRRRLSPRAVLLICLAALVGGTLAACTSAPGAVGTPTNSATQGNPPIHLVVEGHFATQSSNSLRETLVALDARDGHVAWKHPLETPAADDGDFARYPAVLANGLAYLGYYYTPKTTALHYSVVEALDAATGQTRWRQELDAGHESEIAGLPVVDGSTVYLSAGVYQTAGQGGVVAAFDAQSGKVRWSKPLTDTPDMPAVAGGDVFVLTKQAQGFAGRLLALRASDGSTAWDYASDVPLVRGGDLDNAYSTAPVVSGDLAFPQAIERNPDGGADVAQLAIDTKDGSLAWQYETGGIAATPAIAQDGATLCLGVTTFSQAANSSGVVALATASGQKRWGATLPNYASGCVTSGSTFLVNTGSFAGEHGSLLALNSQDGTRLWETTTGAPVDADGVLAPTVAGDVAVDLVVPSDAGTSQKTTIVVARASDGAVLWRHEFDGHAERMSDIEGDLLYNAEQQGSTRVVVAYALRTGARLWSYALAVG